MPPKGVAAYGLVAFASMPVPHEVERYKNFCEAFKAALLPDDRMKDTPLSLQMITYWPVLNKNTDEARRFDCSYLVSNYDLKAGLDAIKDADVRNERLAERRGPYLIAWSPASSRASKDRVVLIMDLSGVEGQRSALEIFKSWRQKIVDDPNLWQNGFEPASVTRLLRDTLDKYGGSIQLMKLF